MTSVGQPAPGRRALACRRTWPAVAVAGHPRRWRRRAGQTHQAIPVSCRGGTGARRQPCRRLALYGEVQRRRAAGEPLIAIARAVKLARGTVRTYAHATSFPERSARRPGHSIIDQHLPHLQARVAEGCEDGAVLWRELQARGFTGRARLVRCWLSERRRTPARTAPHRWRGQVPVNPGSVNDSIPTPLPAARQLAWLLVQSAATLPVADAVAVARVEQDKDAATVAMLARRFTALVRGCTLGNQTDATAAGAELDAWLAEASRCGVQTMEAFAAGLKQDAKAIRAALTTPWSNGHRWTGQPTKNHQARLSSPH